VKDPYVEWDRYLLKYTRAERVPVVLQQLCGCDVKIFENNNPNNIIGKRNPHCLMKLIATKV
jgi:hypothetical protein